MAILNMMETSLPENWSLTLYNEKNFDLAAPTMEPVVRTYFVGVSETLKGMKNKEYPVAFVFEDDNLEFIVGAIVRFIPSENEEMPGHWNYVWTFDKADIPENSRILRLTDVNLHGNFRAIATQNQFGFRTPESIVVLGNHTMKYISKWLSDNAKEEEENGIKLDGIFQARCVVEDHEVYKSLELIGETKAIIKDDAGAEV